MTTKVKKYPSEVNALMNSVIITGPDIKEVREAMDEMLRESGNGSFLDPFFNTMMGQWFAVGEVTRTAPH